MVKLNTIFSNPFVIVLSVIIVIIIIISIFRLYSRSFGTGASLNAHLGSFKENLELEAYNNYEHFQKTTYSGSKSHNQNYQGFNQKPGAIGKGERARQEKVAKEMGSAGVRTAGARKNPGKYIHPRDKTTTPKSTEQIAKDQKEKR